MKNGTSGQRALGQDLGLPRRNGDPDLGGIVVALADAAKSIAALIARGRWRRPRPRRANSTATFRRRWTFSQTSRTRDGHAGARVISRMRERRRREPDAVSLGFRSARSSNMSHVTIGRSFSIPTRRGDGRCRDSCSATASAPRMFIYAQTRPLCSRSAGRMSRL